jgi:uncharacterized membrane protein YeaQ/YmgE (transglycosylase-associated protein family)
MIGNLIWWALAGLVAGWATGKIMSGKGYGALADIAIGIVGAIVGGWLMGMLGIAGSGGFLYTVLVAILGACLLTFVIRKIRG